MSNNPFLINNRTSVHKDSGGKLKTKDPCYTTPNKIVINYTNMAYVTDLTDCSDTFFVCNNPIAHKDSKISKSKGDEAGDQKGKKSGTIQGEATFTSASPNVFVENKPLVRNGDKMISNKGNTDPAPLSQSNGPAPQGLVFQGAQVPYPPVTFDLPDVEVAHYEYQAPMYRFDVDLKLTGSLTFTKDGTYNPYTMHFDEEGYQVEAGEEYKEFFASATIDLKEENKLVLSAGTAGEFWSTSYNFTPPNEITFNATPKPISTKKNDWSIEGELGYDIDIKAYYTDGTPVDLKNYWLITKLIIWLIPAGAAIRMFSIGIKATSVTLLTAGIISPAIAEDNQTQT